MKTNFLAGELAAIALLLATFGSGCQPATRMGETGGATEVADVALDKIGLTADGWFQSYEQAVAKARETNKPILIDFTGSDWCGWCIRLDEEVFSKSEFKQWAKDKVVLLKLDYPRQSRQPAALKQQNLELANKFQIAGYPTILFVDANGKMIGQYGYDQGGPTAWTTKATQILSGGNAG